MIVGIFHPKRIGRHRQITVCPVLTEEVIDPGDRFKFVKRHRIGVVVHFQEDGTFIAGKMSGKLHAVFQRPILHGFHKIMRKHFRQQAAVIDPDRIGTGQILHQQGQFSFQIVTVFFLKAFKEQIGVRQDRTIAQRVVQVVRKKSGNDGPQIFPQRRLIFFMGHRHKFFADFPAETVRQPGDQFPLKGQDGRFRRKCGWIIHRGIIRLGKDGDPLVESNSIGSVQPFITQTFALIKSAFVRQSTTHSRAGKSFLIIEPQFQPEPLCFNAGMTHQFQPAVGHIFGPVSHPCVKRHSPATALCRQFQLARDLRLLLVTIPEPERDRTVFLLLKFQHITPPEKKSIQQK